MSRRFCPSVYNNLSLFHDTPGLYFIIIYVFVGCACISCFGVLVSLVRLCYFDMTIPFWYILGMYGFLCIFMVCLFMFIFESFAVSSTYLKTTWDCMTCCVCVAFFCYLTVFNHAYSYASCSLFSIWSSHAVRTFMLIRWDILLFYAYRWT